MKFNRSLYFVVVGSLFAACSQQGEGQRCIAANADSDCASGLICVVADELESESSAVYKTDRCCPEGRSSDSRCARRGSDSKKTDTVPNTTGAAGNASAGSVGGASGASAASEASAGSFAGGSDGVAGTGTEAADSAGTAGALP